MRVIVHDMPREQWEKLDLDIKEDDIVVWDDGSIHPCTGCFGCWFKTPGRCIVPDRYQKMGENIAKATDWILITKNTFGGFSSFTKNVMDRSISYVSPFFTVRDGEMHHALRYDRMVGFSAIFYGEDMTQAEKDTAYKLVYANARNLNGDVKSVKFVSTPEEVTL